MDKKKRFNQIAKAIKEVKIQGAREVAKEGLKAYKLIPTQASKNKLLSLRPTEPMLANILKQADKITYAQLINKLKANQEIINKQVLKLIKQNNIIFTHCHSNTVIQALIFAKKKGKKFEVYNTETRPLYQGRKTAKELKKAKIKITMFADAAVSIALSKEQGTKEPDLVFFGADAISKKGVINKVGSEMFAQIARINKIPVYILADSLKYSLKKIRLEKRDFEEFWKNAPKNIRIENPAFEFVKKKYITAIISELGKLKYKDFLREVKKN